MKIQWLNDDCTEAIVTRGFWWWKRQAHVAFSPEDGRRWVYSNDEDCEGWLSTHLTLAGHAKRTGERQQRRDAAWNKPATLPPARLVERKP